MNEEMRNENIETEEAAMDTCVETEASGGKGVGKLVVAAIAVAGVGIALLHKNKDKLENRKIKKLEKKGYTVLKPREYDNDIVDISEEETE